MGGKDAPRSFLPQYGALNATTVRTPRPFRHSMIWPIFDRNYEHKVIFRQHMGQQVLTKLFSPKSTHQTGQKTYLQFSYISHTFLAILDWTFYLRKPPFRNNLVHFPILNGLGRVRGFRAPVRVVHINVVFWLRRCFFTTRSRFWLKKRFSKFAWSLLKNRFFWKI